MHKLILFLLVAVASPAFAAEPRTDSLTQAYRHILLESYSGSRYSQDLDPRLRQEFLAQPLMKDLADLYSKSARKTLFPDKSSDRHFFSALKQLYEQRLIDIAMRPERAGLNLLVAKTFLESATNIELENRHLQILGKIYDDLYIDLIEAYKQKDYIRMASFGSLSLYVLTEVYVRISLFNSVFENQQVSLENVFWRHGNYVHNQSAGLAIDALEKFSGIRFADLVAEYQNIFATQSCKSLLAARHPSSEG